MALDLDNDMLTLSQWRGNGAIVLLWHNAFRCHPQQWRSISATVVFSQTAKSNENRFNNVRVHARFPG